MIFIIDFGSQTCHLISRRLTDLGIENKIFDPKDVIKMIGKEEPKGIIFSGGPKSVYEKGAPTIDKKFFTRYPDTRNMLWMATYLTSLGR